MGKIILSKGFHSNYHASFLYGMIMMFILLMNIIVVMSFALTFPATAEVVDPAKGLEILLLPVDNETDLMVWMNQYYPQNVITTEMQKFFGTLLKDSPLAHVRILDEIKASEWMTNRWHTPGIAVKISLYRFISAKKDMIGTQKRGAASIRMTIYDAVTGEEKFSSIIHGRDNRWTPEFTEDYLSYKYWESFSRSPYWGACKEAMTRAFHELMSGYTGYRIAGRIIAEIKDTKKPQPANPTRRFIINLGRNQSLKNGNILPVIEGVFTHTVDPEKQVVVMPKIKGKVKVVFLKENEAEVELIEENDKDLPVVQGDAVGISLYSPRKGGF